MESSKEPILDTGKITIRDIRWMFFLLTAFFQVDVQLSSRNPISCFEPVFVSAVAVQAGKAYPENHMCLRSRRGSNRAPTPRRKSCYTGRGGSGTSSKAKAGQDAACLSGRRHQYDHRKWWQPMAGLERSALTDDRAMFEGGGMGPCGACARC